MVAITIAVVVGVWWPWPSSDTNAVILCCHVEHHGQTMVIKPALPSGSFPLQQAALSTPESQKWNQVDEFGGWRGGSSVLPMAKQGE